MLEQSSVMGISIHWAEFYADSGVCQEQDENFVKIK